MLGGSLALLFCERPIMLGKQDEKKLGRVGNKAVGKKITFSKYDFKMEYDDR